MPLVDPATIATFRFRMGLTFSVRYDQPLDGFDDSKDVPVIRNRNHFNPGVANDIGHRIAHDVLGLHYHHRVHVPCPLSGQTFQRMQYAIGTRVHRDRREVAPGDNTRFVDHEQGTFADALLVAICTILFSDRTLGLEVGEQRKMKFTLLRVGLVTPCAIDRNAQYLGVVLMKHWTHLIVECHLVTTHWAPVSRIESQDDRPAPEFLQ
jgi:hypothetical protein